MRGQILVFNEQKEAGAIVTDDGRRFLFHINEWEDVVPPDRGMVVSFMLDADNRARQVQLALPDAMPAAATKPHAPPRQHHRWHCGPNANPSSRCSRCSWASSAHTVSTWVPGAGGWCNC